MNPDHLQAALGSGQRFTAAQLVWYVLVASGVFLTTRLLLRRLFQPRKISPRSEKAAQMGREALLSLRSLLVFGVVAGLTSYAARSGWTQLYDRVDERGWTWFWVSIGLMVLIHDTYFYWTHRLMHHPRLFKTVHREHHRSVSPTPWAAYSFSAWEALVQAGIGPLIVFTLPVHDMAFVAFMLWQIGFNVLGHCGYEIFPRWFLKTPFGVVMNTPTHHAMHHEAFQSNYGIYFNVWDRLMRTNHPAYEERFAEVVAPAKAAA